MGISRLGLGTANLGARYGIHDNPGFSSAEILAAAEKSGITLIDTARHYSNSEEILSRHLDQNPSYRPQVITKFLISSIEADIEKSLSLLKENTHGVLWHNFDPTAAGVDAGLRKLEIQRKKFPALKWGCSTYGSVAAAKAVETGAFEILEIEYNLLNTSAYDAIRENAGKSGMLVLFRSVFQKGYLSALTLKNPPARLHKDSGFDGKLFDLLPRLEKLAAGLGKTLEEMALRFVLDSTESGIALFGAFSTENIRENAKTAAGAPFEKAELDAIKKAVADYTAGFNPDLFDLRNWV